jgi:hypothetical protein
MGSSATPFLLAARPLLFLYGDSITQLGSKVFQFPSVYKPRLCAGTDSRNM